MLRYRHALRVGYEHVRGSGLLTARHVLDIQRELERNHAGFRRLPGTALHLIKEGLLAIPVLYLSHCIVSSHPGIRTGRQSAYDPTRESP